MATAEITVCTAMGGGVPAYSPPIDSQTLTTSTTPANSNVDVRGGDYVRILARGAAVYVTINGSSSGDPRFCIPDGGVIDIGPLKQGDVINVRDVV